MPHEFPDTRSSHWRCSAKKAVLRNFAKFTEKHLCQRLFFNKVAGLRVHRVATNDNEWNNEWQRVTTNDNEWQRVVKQMKMSDKEWQQVTKNDNE